MQEAELKELITKILERKTETSKIEFKSAKGGTPEKLYDSLSSFSNTSGGIIIFGIDTHLAIVVIGHSAMVDLFVHLLGMVSEEMFSSEHREDMSCFAERN